MRSVADNNGEILARLSTTAIILTAAAVLLLSVYIARSAERHQSTLIYPRFLPTLGFAASIAPLAHASVYLITGAGSDYALRKHTYVLMTVLVVQICSIFAELLTGRGNALRNNWRSTAATLICPIILSTAAAWISLSPKSRSLVALLEAQDHVRALVAADNTLYGRSLTQISELSNFDNFLITTVELRVPDEAARLMSYGSASPIDHRIRRCIRKKIRFEVLDCAS
jgi:hypothetical protein